MNTVVSRVYLDMLRSRKSRREESIEAHLPDSFNSQENIIDPEQEAILADSIGVALLVILGNLKPAERITFVLHDVFAMPFNEIAPNVGKSETATMQLASRARHRVRGAKATEVDIPDVILRDDRQIGSLRVTRGAVALAKQVSGRVQKAAQLALVNGTVGIIVALKEDYSMYSNLR